MKIDNVFSYILGLAQTDGHLNERPRGRGTFSITLNEKDANIIEAISEHIDCNYTVSYFEQKSNFGVSSEYGEYKTKMVSIRVCNKDFRKFINECGMPYGKKCKIIKPPLHLEYFSSKDYIRGILDGDGSLGFDKKGHPFLNLTIASVFVKDFYNQYISEITGRPLLRMKRRQKGGTYDMSVHKEDAVEIVKEIYYDGCMSINRKKEKAELIKLWVRPENMRKRFYQKAWTEEEDNYIMTHSVKESMKFLGRTKSSVDMRKARVKYGKGYGISYTKKDM